ncbi:U-box domain-containing protein 9-like [Abrus precatorius]|uniref:RING-type E3 ubiquitin transferase n=1 Tax=Abrus precatorius TaxID=3816 RepID=A0A8B8M7R0_ABRPR|nr:U-box domain-containing protein 9-like [Abrus precatorius]
MGSEDNRKRLQAKLRQLMSSIVEDDDTSLLAFDDAIQALNTLKDFKYSLNFGNLTVPPELRCSLSGRFITDPIFLTNKETYDRKSIEKWMDDVNRLCDQTKRILSDCAHTPNNSAQCLISKWCEENGVVLDDRDYAKLTEDHKHRLHSSLYQLSLSEPQQLKAAKELRQLTARIPPFRELLGNEEVIHLLLSPLSGGIHGVHPQIHEDLVTTVLNASILEDNRKIFGKDEKIISLLIDSVRSGTIEARSNAASTIFLLSSIQTNRLIFGSCDALKHLVELLGEENESAMKAAASALSNLCLEDVVKEWSVEEGIVDVIIDKITDNIQVKQMMSLLALLADHLSAVQALADNDAVTLLLGVIRDNTGPSIKEYSISILYKICQVYNIKLLDINDEEEAYRSLSNLAETGTPRAKRIANIVLDLLKLRP